MKPSKEQIQEFYSSALKRCVDGFGRLDDADWKKKVDKWTAKEHLANTVGAQEDQALPLTRQAIAGQPASIPGFEKREDATAFHEACVAKRRDLPVSELLARMKPAFEEHLQMLEGLSEADLDRPANSPGWDRPGTIRDLFHASYLFLPSQYQQIRKVAKKKLPHWIEASTPEQVHYHLDRVFHYMPLIYWSSRGGDQNTTYLFTMEGPGGGQWTVYTHDGRADSADGAPEKFDLELKTKPEIWMDLSTGDLNPVFAITMRKVHLAGNVALAMKLDSLFSVE